MYYTKHGTVNAKAQKLFDEISTGQLPAEDILEFVLEAKKGGKTHDLQLMYLYLQKLLQDHELNIEPHEAQWARNTSKELWKEINYGKENKLV